MTEASEAERLAGSVEPCLSCAYWKGASDRMAACEHCHVLRFESLLAEISARFVNLPASDVAVEIGNAQQRVCECLGLDLSALWQWESGTPEVLVLTHYYRRFDKPPVPERMEAAEYFPWTYREVMAGRSVVIDSVEDVPAGAERDVAAWRHFGLRNVLVFPLAVGSGPTFGTVSFHDVAAARSWSQDVTKRLALVAQVFANAIVRTHAEEALRESEERLALATEAAEAGTWALYAQQGRFWVSAKVLELFGLLPADSLDVERFVDLVHPEDRRTVRDAMALATGSREMRVVEYRLVRPDGQVRWMQSRGRSSGNEGSPRFMGITSDITQRKEGERALHESAARMAAAMDVAELGYYEVLNGVHVSFADEQAREILGWSEADAKAGRILEFWSEHLHPEDGASILEVNRSLNEGERDRITVDYRFLHPERGVLHIHHLAHVIERDAGGHALRTIGVLKDITERMRTEDALRSRELRLASATEIAGLGFYELREGRRVAFLDPRGRDLLGVPPEEEDRIREYWLSRISPEDQPLVASAIRRGLEEGRELGVLEYRYLHPTRGEIWLHHFSRIVEREPSGGAIRTVGVFQDVTERKRAEQDLRQALDEVRQLRDRLQNENVYLREQIRVETGHGAIVGESEPVQKMLRLAARVAPTDSAVLITGETGTGKELLAQAIHDQSARKAKTMVKVNCAALPAPLIESELFGREKGAYTGAMTQQIGRFELADGSTIFLDEIGDLPLDLQSKLLRVLQDGRFERLGGTRTVKADVRVIAATNRDLASMVKAGTFREDLFHRLNVFPIEAPPLRARASDIPTLTWTFVQELNARMGRTIDAIPKATMEALKRYPWPGNVRELRNVLERAMIVSDGRSLAVELPETDPAAAEAGLSTLEDVERRHIRDVLERTRWRISGKGGAAEVLGLIPTTLHSRMKKLGITRPGQRAYLFGGAG